MSFPKHSVLDLVTEAERLPLLDWLLSKCEPIPFCGCHLWHGWNDGKHEGDSYGKFQLKGVGLMVHRATWELAHGRIGRGLLLDHRCQIRSCCLPSTRHFEPVTPGVNTRRGGAILYASTREVEDAFAL